MLTIRQAESADRAEWERLWLENCLHFGAIQMSAATVDGVVGLAHSILHPHTFSLKPVCCLEDLWVSPRARGQGVATALIDDLIRRGHREGWRRLYWETAFDNAAARRLYERLAVRRRSLVYQIDIGG